MANFLVEVSDGLYIEIEADESLKRTNLSDKKEDKETTNKIERYSLALAEFASKLATSLSKSENAPSEIEIQFGAVLTFDAQAPLKIVSTSTKANLNVKLKWS